MSKKAYERVDHAIHNLLRTAARTSAIITIVNPFAFAAMYKTLLILYFFFFLQFHVSLILYEGIHNVCSALLYSTKLVNSVRTKENRYKGNTAGLTFFFKNVRPNYRSSDFRKR
jgi:hypothetical protein